MKNATLATAPTEDCYGFFGTIHSNEKLGGAAMTKAWRAAFESLTEKGYNATLTRNFLRSRMGRHLADATSFYEGKLADRIQQASGEDWVAKEMAKLDGQGFGKTLFDCDPIA